MAPRPGPLAAVFLLLAFALSGCLGGAGPPDEAGAGAAPAAAEVPPVLEGIGPEYVVLENPLGAARCQGVDLLLEVTPEHAQGLLPAPLVAAPSPATGANAALLLELRACASSALEGGAPLARSLLMVVIEPPRLPALARDHDAANRTHPADAEVAYDFFVAAAYTDATWFSRLLHQSGIPREEASLALGVVEAGALTLADARVERSDGGFDGVIAAATGTELMAYTEHRRAWQTTSRGVQLFEELVSLPDGAAPERFYGTGTCVVDPAGLYAAALPAGACVPLLARTTPSFDVKGAAFWFHDTLLLE